MTRNPIDKSANMPGVSLLLPVAYLLHLAEEWFGGFTGWTRAALGSEVSPGRFISINAVAFLIICTGILMGYRNKYLSWFCVSVAALFFLNGILHLIATFGMGLYSPGSITGMFVYIPLSLWILRKMSAKLSAGIFIASIFAGILMHGLVAIIAFSG